MLTTSFAFAASLYTTRGLFADLLSSPGLTEGPFYPDHLPLDLDNDLIVINNSTTLAVGTITQLSGRPARIAEDPFGSEKPKLPQGKPAGFTSAGQTCWIHCATQLEW